MTIASCTVESSIALAAFSTSDSKASRAPLPHAKARNFVEHGNDGKSRKGCMLAAAQTPSSQPCSVGE
eukprot:CAMPEP_0204535178 /NCGR_PEP_ID=MMETSP0661-20131031/13511_1 /ASSEMBLY_ACC=CAM_ASM_000606 /TAXON_ID=109239 /ORGANISM="Alexandrium margalefi, Strain AMGDE01CS-322" /LENGTH=67 /DNA_ID=CAMNT_0051541663 /DNA_START=105 /DNA_END=308 /DNA_ORIENTATION=-